MYLSYNLYYRKTLKETKLSTNAKVQKLSKGAREKQTLEYLANFTKQSVVLEEDEEKEEVSGGRGGEEGG